MSCCSCIKGGVGCARSSATIEFEPGDYLLIPRGIIYQPEFDSEDNRLLVVESFHPVYTPKRYRNHFGQLLEHAPYSERDYKLPTALETHDESGRFHRENQEARHFARVAVSLRIRSTWWAGTGIIIPTG